MFKISYVSHIDGLKIARELMREIYEENPKFWPNSLTPEHFDGGLYLVREASTQRPVGFVGWQEREEVQQLLDRPIEERRKEAGNRLHPKWDQFFKSMGCRQIKVGYYSVGVLPAYRRNGFAKEAIAKLIRMKSAGVDCVRALIMSSNKPSLALADALGVEKQVKQAQTVFRPEDRLSNLNLLGAATGASLPTASLYQYLARDYPAVRELLRQTPYVSRSKLQRRIRVGDVLFEGAMKPNEVTMFGRMARGGQGITPYHAFMVGPGRNVFHGGGEHGYVDEFGRRMQPFIYENPTPRQFVDPDYWKGVAESWDSELEWAKKHKTKLVDPAYRKTFWQRLSALMQSSKNEVVLGTRATGMPKGRLPKELAGVLDEMNARPYGTGKAMLVGLENLLLPRSMRGAFSSAAGKKWCVPGSSTCGELPGGILSRLGLWKMSPGSTLPIDLLASGKLKTYGMTIPNSRLDPLEAKAQILKVLSRSRIPRVGLGLATIAGAGGLGFGASRLFEHMTGRR